MTTLLMEKGNAFRALHSRAGAFILPNPWDAGSARLLAGLGFEALATTSAGLAFSLGVRDGSVGRERILENARAIVEATDLPVSADLENCYFDDPSGVADTIRAAGTIGLVGASVEDATGRADAPIYPLEEAVERVAAAAEQAKALAFPFMLTARAENFLHGRPDLTDTITRLQRFQEAGADVLYAPGLPSLEAVAEVVRSVDLPVNVLMGPARLSPTFAQLTSAGVKRVSTGSALSRAALAAFMKGASELKESGSFAFADDAVPFGAINGAF